MNKFVKFIIFNIVRITLLACLTVVFCIGSLYLFSLVGNYNESERLILHKINVEKAKLILDNKYDDKDYRNAYLLITYDNEYKKYIDIQGKYNRILSGAIILLLLTLIFFCISGYFIYSYNSNYDKYKCRNNY